MSSNIFKIAFWNIKLKQSNLDEITKYGVQNDIDLIAVCECPPLTSTSYNGYNLLSHIFPQQDINVFIKSSTKIYYTKEEPHFCILHIKTFLELNLAVVHLNSNMFGQSKSRRLSEILDVKEALGIEEKKYNNKNSILLGDFNDNLFSDLILDWNGCNARLFKFMCSKSTSTRNSHQQDIFYNPMLRLYTDNDNPLSHKGTYFYRANSCGNLCFDQVMLKHPLINYFDNTKLKVIEHLNGKKLIKNHKPHAQQFSDHLPIEFELHI